MKNNLINITKNLAFFCVCIIFSSAFVYATEDLYYKLPAEINDFKNDESAHLKLLTLWNNNMKAFNAIGITGNPWTNNYDSPRINYIEPTRTPYINKKDLIVSPITWTAFPHRVAWYFNTSQNNPYQINEDLLYPLVDDGRLDPKDPALKAWVKQNNLEKDLKKLLKKHKELKSKDLNNFAPLNVPTDICPLVNWDQPKDGWVPFGPPGPRGWKDEYNEWVTTRDKDGKILKISFTAENPEYWFSLWQIDPKKVLELYHELVSKKVKLKDLYLRDDKGKILYDHNNHPVYNPLNKWNFGNRATKKYGGAVHLTSPPNTVGAEIYLGAAASIIRDLPDDNYSPQENICASLYGSPFRNSDPNIGLQANQVVRNLKRPITLTNPISLYMQMPDFSNYTTPDGTPAENFFRVVRGRTAKEAGTDYDQILHAVFEVPKEKGYTVSDIKIAGKQIWWGSQIAETFNQALAATAFPANLMTNQGRMPAVSSQSNPNPYVQPLIRNSILKTINKKDSKVSTATIPLLPATVKPGQTITDMALEVAEGEEGASIKFLYPDGSTVADGIIVTVTDQYHVGKAHTNSRQHKLYDSYVYVMDIAVDKNVPPGQYGVQVTNPGDCEQAPSPGNLIVLPPNENTTKSGGN